MKIYYNTSDEHNLGLSLIKLTNTLYEFALVSNMLSTYLLI